MLFSGYWNEEEAWFEVFHTMHDVSEWYEAHPDDWFYMGHAVWSKRKHDWTEGNKVWGWSGVQLRRSWGVRSRGSRL